MEIIKAAAINIGFTITSLLLSASILALLFFYPIIGLVIGGLIVTGLIIAAEYKIRKKE